MWWMQDSTYAQQEFDDSKVPNKVIILILNFRVLIGLGMCFGRVCIGHRREFIEATK